MLDMECPGGLESRALATLLRNTGLSVFVNPWRVSHQWSYFFLERTLPLAFSFDFQPRYGLCVCSHSLPATTEGENDTEGSLHPSLNTATQASALTSKLSFSPKAL